MENQDIFQKIEIDDTEGVKSFINEHPDKINELGGWWGKTPLMSSCERGNREMTKLLLEAGCQINTKDNLYGWTALHLAVWKNRYEIVEMLLEQEGIQINEGDQWGLTPLMLSCRSRNREMTKLLLDAGCQINTKDNLYGWTALHLAVWKGRYDVVALLLSQDSVELELRDHKKRTPLLLAAASGHLGIIHKLISVGANVNAVDNETNSSLHLLLKRDVFDSEGAPMDILYECCSDLNLKKKEWLSCGVVARYFARQGANFYCKNNNNDTPLDLIKDRNLRKKFQTFLPPQCLWCNLKGATERFYPCEHLAICKSCSNAPLKQCLKCGKPLRSNSEVETPTRKRSSEVSQPTPSTSQPTPSTSQPMLSTSQPVESPKLYEKLLQGVARRLGGKWQQVESPKLDERLLQDVARRLGGKWQEVGRELGIPSYELSTIKQDYPLDSMEQSFQMLRRWYESCDQETCTISRIKNALEKSDCFDALEYLRQKE